MTELEYAWRLGYDKRMEVAEFGAGAFLTEDLKAPYTDIELVLAWNQGWDDAAGSLKAAAWKASA
jgi:hypothetical protein